MKTHFKKILHSPLSIVHYSLFFLFFSCAGNHNIEPEYYIALNQNADSLEQRAAETLRNYWLEITERKIDVSENRITEKKPIFIGYDFLPEDLQNSLTSLKEDGFLISVTDGAVFLAGKKPKASLYAVASFLEDYFGCLKFSPHEDYIPKTDKINFKKGTKIYNPSFDFRRLYFPGKEDKEFSDWYKQENLDEWGMYVHTFNKLIPPEKYYENHPEYFSLIDGRRLKDSQLCLSNPNVINELIKNLGEKIKEQPEKKYWSVSQNDAYNFCECENCKRLYDKYESVSGAYIESVNKIAKAFPDKQISTLAYQFTRSAPKNIKPLPNVNIMLCTIECDRSKPLAEIQNPNSFANDLKNWSALTENIYLWDYVVQFNNYLTPFPNFPVLQPNLRFFKENGIDMIFEQGSGSSWSDLMELKRFLLAKLTWNVNANVDSLAAFFIDKYYGNASKYIQEYYNLINEKIIAHKEKEFLNIYGFPSDYADSFLKPELMNHYLFLMDEAEKAAAEDSVLLDRVKRARLPVDFAWVDIATNGKRKETPAIVATEKGMEINPLIPKLLKNIEEYAAKNKSIKINERSLTPKYFREYTLNKLRRSLIPNKLENAEITILTKYSEKYPVGGEKALNDKLFGALDFHHNWLGFEGNDLIAEIDFKKPTEFSEIKMNFLKAVNSWVFLPVKIKIETSKDGRNFDVLEEKNVDDRDRNYLVKSVPFNFRFNPVEARYLRVTAISTKTCPEWHRGFGKPSWIFVDEIIVN